MMMLRSRLMRLVIRCDRSSASCSTDSVHVRVNDFAKVQTLVDMLGNCRLRAHGKLLSYLPTYIDKLQQAKSDACCQCSSSQHGQLHVPSDMLGCMQIATQSSDEEELYAALGPGREGQNGADARLEADAVEAQVSLLCAMLRAPVLHICKLVGVGLHSIVAAHHL